ncbi:MAG: hypothetical protein B7Y83_04560 [Flavobacteriales bacterium 32-34-25]|nr:MAG: hypothetical protein B7Y83_04560 [Flavobacteriales bacterium 32-34-25]
MKNFTLKLILFVSLAFIPISIEAQRIVQDLDRGVVAIHSEMTKAFVSWRLFATEPSNTGFNLYRSSGGGTAVKLNTSVLTAGTNFTDATANFSVSNEYFVKAVINDVEQEASRSFLMPANTPVQSYISIPLRQDLPGYSARYVRVGDLDGDGDYDFVVVKSGPNEGDVMIAEAYLQDGTFLWRLDCGINSVYKYNNEPGSSTLDVGHGDNIEVYDITGDGKAEVIIRTANGVKFGDGTVLNYPSNNNVQFMSVLNGLTGAEMSRIQYDNPFLAEGPMNGHMGIAYLDGVHPSVVWEAKNRTGDEGFNEMTTAWDWKNGTLVQKWQFLSANQGGKSTPYGHQIRIIDVDGDGKDEICPQGFVIDDDGTLLYTLADQDIFHGDRFFIGDLDPNRPGLEGYGIQQGYSVSGIMWYYFDAKTGKVLLTQKDPANRDMARGNVGDFDPRFPGFEFHTFVDHLYNVSGAPTSSVNMPSSYPNFRILWDGDVLTENLDDGKMTKWNHLLDSEARIKIDGSNYFSGHSVGPNTPSFVGDILGDWREEVVYEDFTFKELRIYTSPIPTTNRIYTLSQNPAYLNSMHVRGYYQGHLTDFYIGDGMQEPPISPIQKADKYWTGTTSAVWDTATSNWSSTAGSALYANNDIVMFDSRGNSGNSIVLNNDVSPKKIWFMNPQGKDFVFSGTGKITGAMDVVKSLSGSVTFNGNYDYTGTTEVSDGVLNVNGSIASKVTIKPKGAIGGTGTYSGGVVLEKGFNIDGGRINPGSGATADLIGSLVINGDLIVPGNNNFAFDIVPESVKLNDDITVNGNIIFSGKNKIIIAFKDGVVKDGTFTLIKSTATLSAVATDFIVEGLDGIPNEIIVGNNQIKLKIVGLRDPGTITWKGTIDNKWDSSTKNFDLNGVQEAFTPKDAVVFDETGLNKSVQLSVTANTSGVTFNATNDYTISGTGAIDGTGDLVKSNTNKVTLDLTKNTYTGKTIVNGGTLAVSVINNGGELSSLGTAANTVGNLVVNNATLQINQNSATDRVLTISGTSSISIPTAANYAIFTGDITGSGNLVKEGAGSLNLLFNNSYSGTTTLKEGKILLRGATGNTSGLGTQGKLIIESGALIMEDRRAYDDPLWNIEVPLGKIGSFTPDGRCNLNVKLTGAGTLNLTTPFIRTEFRGDWSAFTGVLNINGDFRLNNTFGYANAIVNLTGNGLDGTVPNAYLSTSTNRTVRFGALNGIATSRLASANWEIGAKNIDSQFDGVISSNMLTKVGTGSLILTNANTYTGVTNVNGGKLIVNNTTGSGAGTGNLIVNTGGTLSGTGILANTISVASGGTLAPGYPAFGTLTVSKAVTLQAGSTYEASVNAGTNTSDVLATGTNALVLNGTLKITNQNTSAFAIGNTYKIFNGTNITGDFSSINPATPGTGLVWDISALKTTGVIAVVRDPQFVDTDNDGVVDSIDLCANTPTGETVNASGCAPSQLDDDNDGVKNNLDTCPNTPTGETVNASGCSIGQLDDDNDGVKNSLDTCPNTPSGQAVNASGCAQSQLDDDNDGVKNNLDLCANTPAGETVNASGCAPSQLDDDNDGVKNNLDTCPNTPTGETVNVSGCSIGQLDDDNDGVKNSLDLCANTPSGQTVNASGCAQSQLDDDNDGVKNNLDTCPSTPTGVTVNASGCSQGQLDDDNDGVKNSLDTCPNTPSGQTVNASGCAQSQFDDDNDGVKNNLDICPNTPSGTLVDNRGCTVISATAIKAYVVTPTCPGKANGKISVTSNLSGYQYTIRIKGNGIDLSVSTTANWEQTNFTAGTYQITVTIPSIAFEQNYGVVVHEIGAITAKRVESNKTISYTVSGSNEYNVTVNGVSKYYSTETSEASKIEIDANLLQPTNTVIIASNSDCQGVLEDSFTISPSIVVHPNPTSDIVYIENVVKGLIQVYTNSGVLLIEKNAENTKSIDLKGYAAGMYLVKITQGTSVETFKVILK